MKLAHIGESKFMHWALIITFVVLWLIVATVSTLHAITFFAITNTLTLAIFLGVAYEIGQAAVLFSILMTKNREKFLPWALMILLTTLQITANVYASFKYMVNSGSEDWIFWQKSILFGVQATSPEMYQIIISWISGALLPIVALGMTALVAQNIRMMADEEEKKLGSIPDKEVDEIIKNEVEKRIQSTDQHDDELEYLYNLQPPEDGPPKNDEPELKKVKEPSLTEEMKVPKRILNPLKKSSKIKPIKSLDEVIKPSKGEEVIKLIESLDEDIGSIKSDASVSQTHPELTREDTENLDPYLQGGVEVIDAKAIPNK